MMGNIERGVYQMGKYKTILLDADGTLFDYDKAERYALRDTLHLYGVEFSEKALRQYRRANAELWKKIERGETTLATLQISRFAKLFEFMDVKWVKCDPGEFNSLYLKQLEKNAPLTDGAEAVCSRLCRGCALYIITNGIAAAQRGRLARSGILPYMSGIFVSEEIGFHKPHKYFFDAVTAAVGDVPREKILVAGDSLTADIAGGNSAGMDTCWYNPKGEPNRSGVQPVYEISSLAGLLEIVDSQ
jgi:2-haloacid dehalogenase